MSPSRIVIVCVYATASFCFGMLAAVETFGGGHMGTSPVSVGEAVFCATVTVTEIVLGSRKPRNRPGFEVLPPNDKSEQ